MGLFFPKGVMLLNTPDTDGYLASIVNKPNVIMRGNGSGSRIRTSSAVAEELLRIDTCNIFNMQDMMIQVIGTAKIKQALHYTTASPGSAHFGRFKNVTISCNGAYRTAFDVSCASGSPVIYSALANFSSADVGGFIMMDLNNGPFTSTINSVATMSSTLASDITASTTTIPLTSPLPGAPASGFTVKIGSQRMYVTAGGDTSTLTVTRGRGPDLLAVSATAGTAVTTYTATLADNAPFTVSNAVAAARIQPVGTAVMENGFCIGIDHPGASNLDVANTKVDGLSVTNAAVAGIRVGNGTSGNNLDHWGYGITVTGSGYGVFLNSGSFSIRSGDFDDNVVDIRRFGVSSSPVVYDDIRTESPYAFYSMTGSSTVGPPTTLRDIDIVTCNAEDGVPVRHVNSGSLLIENMDVTGSPTVRGSMLFAIAGTAASPCHVTAINVCHSGGTGDLFASVGVGAPGVRTAVKNIINQSRKAPNGVVEVNTVVGNYNSNHQVFAGGFARTRTVVNNTNYTILRTDMKVSFVAALTAPRVATLPTINNTVADGQEFLVVDESGTCSPTNTITVAGQGGVLVNGAASVTLNSPYAQVRIHANGTNWIADGDIAGRLSVTEAPLTPLRFGATGNGTTLDDSAFATMWAQLPTVGGHVYIPSRYNFRLSQPLVLRSGLRFEGGDSVSAKITNSASDVFALVGSLQDIHMHDFGVVSGATDGSTGGIIFNLGALGGTEGISQTTFNNIRTLQQRPDRQTFQSGVWLDVRMRDCNLSSTNSRSVPAIHLLSTTGSLGDNVFEDIRHTDYGGSQSTWALWLEEFSSTTALGNTIRRFNFERPSGGAINLIGQNGAHLDQIWLWDMDQVSVNHGIQLGRHVGGQSNIGVLIERVARPSGTLGSGKADIYSAFDGGSGTTVRGIITAGSQALRVDLGFSPGQKIEDCFGVNASIQSYIPSPVVQTAAGVGATVTRSGYYDDFVITLTTGTGSASGDVVKVGWPNGLRSAPVGVQITPMSTSAVDAGLWVSSLTANDVTIAVRNVIPDSTAGVKFLCSTKRAANG